MKSEGIKTPYSIIYKIGQGNKWTVTEFPRNFKIIAVKKRRKILPILYERIVYNDPEVIEHKLMLKRVHVRKK